MTMSRSERQKALLKTIAAGDGEIVEIKGLDSRDVSILHEMRDLGWVQEVYLYLKGTGGYRVTGLGQEMSVVLEDVIFSVIDEPEPVPAVPSTTEFLAGLTKVVRRSTVAIWKHTKVVASVAVAVIAFVWILLSQVIAPNSYCPLLPSILAEWLAPCAAIASEVTQ